MTFNFLVGQIVAYKGMLLQLGEMLASIKEGAYKEMVGEGVNTWSDFLAQPEIGLSVREANALIRLADWVDAMDVPLERLNLATANFAASKGILERDLVEDMSVLSLKDFKERHYDHVTQDSGPRTYTYLLMKKCNETGNMTKVHDVDEEQLVEKLGLQTDG